MVGTFRILVVEDDSGHALLHERALRRVGVRNELRAFERGEDLIEFLALDHDAENPDVVLLDLRLPGMPGIEVLSRLRGDPALGGLNVLILSTTLDPKEERDCHALGCDGFLLKPLDGEAFLAALQRLGRSPEA